jgi:hypothetical protein
MFRLSKGEAAESKQDHPQQRSNDKPRIKKDIAIGRYEEQMILLMLEELFARLFFLVLFMKMEFTRPIAFSDCFF